MNNLRANPDAGLLVDNLGIAYGVTIENAVGGEGNVDSGTPDFAIVLLNAYGVTATDFLF